MTKQQVSITLVKPVAEYLQETTEKIKLARRADTLDGKVLCLIPNWRPSAVRLLNSLGEILSRRFKLKELVMEQPVKSAMTPGTYGLPLPEAKLNELAQRSDAIITAVGD